MYLKVLSEKWKGIKYNIYKTMQIRGSTGSTCSTMLANALFIRVSCTTSYLNVLPLGVNF